MPLFKDRNGKEWLVELSLGSASQIKREIDVDVFALVEDGLKGLNALLRNPIKLLDALYIACREDCKKAGISDEDFGRAIAGDKVADAGEAFVKAVIDFFPDRDARPALTDLVEKAASVTRHLATEARKKIAETSDAEVASWILKSSHGNSAGSSVPTPGELQPASSN